MDEIDRKIEQDGEWQGELHHDTKDGRRITVASYWSLIHDENNLPKSRLIINIDMTERKKLEAQFLRARGVGKYRCPGRRDCSRSQQCHDSHSHERQTPAEIYQG